MQKRLERQYVNCVDEGAILAAGEKNLHIPYYFAVTLRKHALKCVKYHCLRIFSLKACKLR